MTNYKTKGSAGGNMKLLTGMSQWDSDENFVIGKFQGMSEMKTKIGMADMLDIHVVELNVPQDTGSEYPIVATGDDASCFTNGSFRNNWKKLCDRFGEVVTLPDGTPKVENGEIQKTIPFDTLIRVSRKGTYDTPKHNDCVNVVIELLEVDTAPQATSNDDELLL